MKDKLYLIIILLFSLVLIYENSKNNRFLQNKHIVNVPHPLKTSKSEFPTLSPLPSSTPTPSLIPTATPLPGYCLHVPVLLYHHVQPKALAEDLGQIALNVDSQIFDRQMGYLFSQGYTTLSAKKLVAALRDHTSLPQKSIVITFDDGYKSVYDYAYPILQKYHFTGNLMISTGLIGGSQYLSWDQVKEMARNSLIDFTDHTWSHYAINNGTKDKIELEIKTGKQQLEEYTNQQIDIFTYPYGAFDDNAISILEELGFIGAFSTIPGFWQCDSFIMSLHRNRIGNYSLSEYGL